MTRMQIGQPIREFPGGTWNRMVGGLGRRRPLQDGRPPVIFDLPGALVFAASNRSGSDFAPGDIVRISGSALTPPTINASPPYNRTAQDAVLLPPILSIDTPEADELFGVMIDPLNDGDDDGRVAVVGPAWARVDVTDTTHTTAGPIDDDQDKLASGEAGCRIMYRAKAGEADPEDRLGEQWCVVMLGAGGVAPSLATNLVLVSDEASEASETLDAGADPPVGEITPQGGAGWPLGWIDDEGTDKLVLIEPGDGEDWDDIKVGFQNLYEEVPIPVGFIAELVTLTTADESGEGTTTKTVAKFWNPSDYLRALDSYDGDTPQILMHDAGGNLVWSGGTCS